MRVVETTRECSRECFGRSIRSNDARARPSAALETTLDASSNLRETGENETLGIRRKKAPSAGRACGGHSEAAGAGREARRRRGGATGGGGRAPPSSRTPSRGQARPSHLSLSLSFAQVSTFRRETRQESKRLVESPGGARLAAGTGQVRPRASHGISWRQSRSERERERERECEKNGQRKQKGTSKASRRARAPRARLGRRPVWESVSNFEGGVSEPSVECLTISICSKARRNPRRSPAHSRSFPTSSERHGETRRRSILRNTRFLRLYTVQSGAGLGRDLAPRRRARALDPRRRGDTLSNSLSPNDALENARALYTPSLWPILCFSD